MKTKLTKHKSLLLCAMFLMLFVGTSYSQITPIGVGDYNLCIKNMTNPTKRTIEFDVFIIWTSTTLPVLNDNDLPCNDGTPVPEQRFCVFQGGLDFNYSGLRNGGVITAAFVATAAERALVGPAYASQPWNINQTSKQLRFLPAIISNGCGGNPVPRGTGVKLGKCRLTCTQDFTTGATPNFVWDYVGGLNKTQTKEAVYQYNPTFVNIDATIGAWQAGDGFVDVTGANHCPIPNIVVNPPCASANAGGPYVTCGNIQLNGSVQFKDG